MKNTRIVLSIVLLATILITSGCAWVNFGLDKDGKVQIDDAGGFSSPERGFRILAVQSDTETKLLLGEKLRNAIKTGDKQKVEDAIKIIELVYSKNGEKEVLKLGVKNLATCRVKLASSPFAEKYLNPGEETDFKEDFLPDRIYQLKYIEYRNKQPLKVSINILLESGRTTPITIRDR